MQVQRASRDELPAIRAAYADARATQAGQDAILWPEFEDWAIVAEIERGCLHRVVDGEALVGVFSVSYEDAAIWGDLERGEHIYLHRIARAATYPGRGLMAAVLEWARAHCREAGRCGLRMDTWASNTSLIAFYERLGFRVVGTRSIGADARLPPHYHHGEFTLLEEECAR